MKRLFTLLLISFAALSCEMVDEKLDELLGKKDIVVFAEGTELTANVPSKQTVLNYKFESTLDWEVKTEAEWLEIDPMRGKAGKDIKIQIKVLHNKGKEARTGYADLTLSNDESYRITINQAGAGDENDDIVVDIPNNQIWYTSTDGEIVEPYSGEYNEYADAHTTFGVNIVSNTYVDGKGVIEFDGDVTTIGECAFYDCGSLTSVTIPDSVTTIGECAFYDCGSFTSVTIPDSVTTIGEWAFGYCKSLTSVTIPYSVTIIGDVAFYGCSSLTSVTIPDSVATIGDAAFGGCSSITEFKGKFASEDGRCLIVDGVLNSFAIGCGATDYTIYDNVTSIGNYAFYWCESLTSVTIPDSVTTIGSWVFCGCSSLTSATIPDSVTTIGDAAFCGCSSLTSVTIGDSVAEIGNESFAYCSSLTSVTIGDSVTTIGEWAFGCCRSLTSVIIPDSVTTIGYAAFLSCLSLTSVTIGDSVTTIGDDAFRGCSSLTSVTIPDSVTTIGGSVFAYCDSLTSVYCKATTPPAALFYREGWYAFGENSSGRKIYVPMESVEAYKSASGWSEYADDIVGYNFEMDEVIIPNNPANCEICYIAAEKIDKDWGVDTFGANVLLHEWNSETCEGVITFDADVAMIGHSAFAYCDGLTSITMPDSITTIGEWAFEGCSSLINITIPDRVKSIEYMTFAWCGSLESIIIGESVAKIADGAFFFCGNLKSVTIPDSITIIEGGAFNGCRNIAEFNCKFSEDNGRILVQDGTLLVLAQAGLTEYTIPNIITSIGDMAFAYCNGLTSITIPESVTSIGGQAFRYCDSLTSITIPEGVTSISYDAFQGCINLTSVYCKAVIPPTAVLHEDGYWNTFNDNTSGRKIYVPMESVEAYKSANGWGDYADAIVGYDF